MEREKQQKEADLKTKTAEITTLQKELEVLAAAAKKLDGQKGDAQKRLDELEKKVRFAGLDLHFTNAGRISW